MSGPDRKLSTGTFYCWSWIALGRSLRMKTMFKLWLYCNFMSTYQAAQAWNLLLLLSQCGSHSQCHIQSCCGCPCGCVSDSRCSPCSPCSGCSRCSPRSCFGVGVSGGGGGGGVVAAAAAAIVGVFIEFYGGGAGDGDGGSQ